MKVRVQGVPSVPEVGVPDSEIEAFIFEEHPTYLNNEDKMEYPALANKLGKLVS